MLRLLRDEVRFMRVVDFENGLPANGRCGKPASKKATDGKSAVDDADWFYRSAQSIYPHKPGTILHVITGLGDERLCQRYASGEVRPPAYFLRALLRGEHGRQWLEAVMQGSNAEWWPQMLAALKLASEWKIERK